MDRPTWFPWPVHSSPTLISLRSLPPRPPDRINTCIGCNQACLDHTFSLQITSCLVNPRACHETVLTIDPTPVRRAIAVVGSGVWGPRVRSDCSSARSRGHAVRGR